MVKAAQTRQLYVATESFGTEIDGRPVTVVNGTTLVREGHELLARYPQHFKPAEAHFEVEEATAAPGEKRAR